MDIRELPMRGYYGHSALGLVQGAVGILEKMIQP